MVVYVFKLRVCAFAVRAMVPLTQSLVASLCLLVLRLISVASFCVVQVPQQRWLALSKRVPSWPHLHLLICLLTLPLSFPISSYVLLALRVCLEQVVVGFLLLLVLGQAFMPRHCRILVRRHPLGCQDALVCSLDPSVHPGSPVFLLQLRQPPLAATWGQSWIGWSCIIDTCERVLDLLAVCTLCPVGALSYSEVTVFV